MSKLGLLSVEKMRLSRDFDNVYKYSREQKKKEMGTSLVPCDRTVSRGTNPKKQNST